MGIKRKYPYLTRGLEENRGFISIMFVRAEYQGKGYGKALLNEVEKRLEKEQVREITYALTVKLFYSGVDLNYEKALPFLNKMVI